MSDQDKEITTKILSDYGEFGEFSVEEISDIFDFDHHLAYAISDNKA